jgi:para-nitrobenzyl esterase
MKKKILFLAFALCMSTTCMVAQTGAPVSACDGMRYTKQVFVDHTVETIPYGSNITADGNTITMSMDIYQPKGDSAALRPVIVMQHGGTFIFGNKSDMAGYCIDMARRGYVAVSVQYRLYPLFQLPYPDSIAIMRQAIMAMGDMKAAIRYLREDAATVKKYRVHPDWIFSGGYSAGAISALHVAQLDMTDPMPTFISTAITSLGGIHGNTGTATNQTYPSSVKAVLSLSGGLYDPSWIDSDDVPMHSIHGTADNTVYYTSGLAANLINLNGSGNLHARANAIGLPNTLLTVTGGGHTNIYSGASYAPQLAQYINDATVQLHNMFCTPLDTDYPDAAAVSTWSLVPNPTSGDVRIALPTTLAQADVQVYNAIGGLVLAQKLLNGSTLSLGSLTPGLYLVRVEGMEEVLKLVKE